MKSGFVALAGRPNAGKSTLLNALMNEKLAIVSPKPQTTRSEIRGIMTLPAGQIVFTDTPGIHKPMDRLGSRMNKQTASVIRGVDLVYLVVDADASFSTGDEYVLRMIGQLDVPVFLILNKIDLLKKEKVLNLLTQWQKRFSFAEIFPLSSLRQENFDDLIQTTFSYLPEGELLYPEQMNTDSTDDFRIAEIVREKILKCTEQEVPHSAGVLVEHKEQEEDGSLNVQVLILVEREGQKGIMIGRSGKMMARIRAEAEKDLNRIYAQRIKLELYVRVEDNWRNKDRRISDFGYGMEDE